MKESISRKSNCPSAEEVARVDEALEAVQTHQREFWRAVSALEDVLSSVCDDTCELDDSTDFNDLAAVDVIKGHGWEGRK